MRGNSFGHQQLLRSDFERVEEISSKIEDQLLEKADAVLQDCKVMIISDYGKGLLTKSFIQSLISKAQTQQVTVLVDPKGFDYSIYAGADIVTPNKKELSEATRGMSVETDDEVINAAQVLMDVSGIKAIVATRSKDGMSVCERDKKSHIRSASDIEVFDVSGAGDTVIATIAASLAAGGDLVQAASLANVAGSVVVSKVGTAPIRTQDLMEYIETRDIYEQISDETQINRPNIDRTRQAPILTWEEAKEETQRWKARGLKVGFTNGCFDVLHFGHVTYLN